MKAVPFFDLISSDAKLRVLNTLCDYRHDLTLRQIEALTHLAIRSVQVAIESLVDKKIVLLSKKNKRKYYQINSLHPNFTILKKIFELIENDKIEKNSKKFSKKAQSTLLFCTDQFEILRKCK